MSHVMASLQLSSSVTVNRDIAIDIYYQLPLVSVQMRIILEEKFSLDQTNRRRLTETADSTGETLLELSSLTSKPSSTLWLSG